MSMRPPSLISDREEDIDECEEINEDDLAMSPEPSGARQGDAEQGIDSPQQHEDDKQVFLLTSSRKGLCTTN